MRKRWVSVSLVAIAVGAIAQALSPATVTAQGGAPAYTPPRTATGQPDLQGIWRAWNLAQHDLEDHGASPGVPAGRGFVVDPPDGKIPYRPEALEKRKRNLTKIHETDPYKNSDPLAKCYLPGIPRLTYLGWPFQIIQTPQYAQFFYEWHHKRRLIPFNMAPPETRDVSESNWLGMPRGRWEGNTLVVDVKNFNGYTWFDKAGNFHSDALTVVERYTLLNADTLQYEATMTDPKTFTRPWTIRMTLQRQKDTPILDYECTAMLDELGIHHTWPRDFDVIQ